MLTVRPSPVGYQVDFAGAAARSWRAIKTVEQIMRGHVFPKLPKYCLALKPGMVWVSCPDCGTPHREYLGPKDHDERNAEILLLREELRIAASILATEHASHPVRAASRARTRRRQE